MEQPATLSSAARRNEDIALDLLKFIATTAGVGRPAVGSTGFTTPSANKADDQVAHLLGRYPRAPGPAEAKGGRYPGGPRRSPAHRLCRHGSRRLRQKPPPR